ncbi:dihydrofolate reductase family protein [Candidatus Kapaibacterium sp.]
MINLSKVILYIAASIDGYIAGINDDLEWLDNHSNPESLDYGYNEFYKSVGTAIMGRKTYEKVLQLSSDWPYKDISSYIATQITDYKTDPSDTFIVNDISPELINSLKSKSDKDIWLVGGGKLTGEFLEKKLLDKMIITYIPIILGAGIKLFEDKIIQSSWSLDGLIKYPNGVYTVSYEVIR